MQTRTEITSTGGNRNIKKDVQETEKKVQETNVEPLESIEETYVKHIANQLNDSDPDQMKVLIARRVMLQDVKRLLDYCHDYPMELTPHALLHELQASIHEVQCKQWDHLNNSNDASMEKVLGGVDR